MWPLCLIGYYNNRESNKSLEPSRKKKKRKMFKMGQYIKGNCGKSYQQFKTSEFSEEVDWAEKDFNLKFEHLFCLLFQVLDFADWIPTVVTRSSDPCISNKTVVTDGGFIWLKFYPCKQHLIGGLFHPEALPPRLSLFGPPIVRW